jgi:hypothetical protein
MFKISNKLARLAAVSSILAVLGATMVLPMTAYAASRTITIDNYLGYCKSLYGSSGYAYNDDRNGYYCGDAAHSPIPGMPHYSQISIPADKDPHTIPGYVGG